MGNVPTFLNYKFAQNEVRCKANTQIRQAKVQILSMLRVGLETFQNTQIKLMILDNFSEAEDEWVLRDSKT